MHILPIKIFFFNVAVDTADAQPRLFWTPSIISVRLSPGFDADGLVSSGPTPRTSFRRLESAAGAALFSRELEEPGVEVPALAPYLTPHPVGML